MVDVFTPSTGSVNRIVSSVAGKATQSPNVVVNLNYSAATPASLTNAGARANSMLASWGLPERLREVIVFKAGNFW